MDTPSTPFEEHNQGTDPASASIDPPDAEAAENPGSVDDDSTDKAPLLVAADRLLRRSLYNELLAAGEAMRQLASGDTWTAEEAADLYDRRAGLWRDLGALVPYAEQALYLAVVVAQIADQIRAEELRASARRKRNAS